MLEIEFLTDNPDLIAILERYWAHDDNGNFIEKYDSIASKLNISKSVFTEIIKENCQVFVTNIFCDCGKYAKIRFRSDFTKIQSKNHKYTCPECIEKNFQLKALQEKNYILAQQEKFNQLLASQDDFKFDESKTNYIDAALAYLIYVEFEDKLNCNIKNDECIKLSPNRANITIFQKLLSLGILKISKMTPYTVIMDSLNGESYLDLSKIIWQISENPLNTIPLTIKEFITERALNPTPEEIVELWKIVSIEECIACFESRCNEFRLPKWQATEEDIESIKYSLQFNSIPQTFNHIYSIIRDLAAGTQKKRFNIIHIRNMFPASLKRRVNFAVANSWEIYPMRRTTALKTPLLTTLLYDFILGREDDWIKINSKNIASRAQEVVASRTGT